MLLTSATFACTNSCCLHANHHNRQHPSQAFEERGAVTAPSRHPCSPWGCPDRRPAQPNQGVTPDAVTRLVHEPWLQLLQGVCSVLTRTAARVWASKSIGQVVHRWSPPQSHLAGGPAVFVHVVGIGLQQRHKGLTSARGLCVYERLLSKRGKGFFAWWAAPLQTCGMASIKAQKQPRTLHSPAAAHSSHLPGTRKGTEQSRQRDAAP